jgi:hypothetical protein
MWIWHHLDGVPPWASKWRRRCCPAIHAARTCAGMNTRRRCPSHVAAQPARSVQPHRACVILGCAPAWTARVRPHGATRPRRGDPRVGQLVDARSEARRTPLLAHEDDDAHPRDMGVVHPRGCGSEAIKAPCSDGPSLVARSRWSSLPLRPGPACSPACESAVCGLRIAFVLRPLVHRAYVHLRESHVTDAVSVPLPPFPASCASHLCVCYVYVVFATC